MPYKDKDKEKESKAKYEAKRSGRTRNFATVVYPESAPEDWINKLEELHVSVLVSHCMTGTQIQAESLKNRIIMSCSCLRVPRTLKHKYSQFLTA